MRAQTTRSPFSMTDTGHMPPSNPCKPQMVMDFDLGEGQPTRLYFSTPHAVELAWCAHEVLPALQRIEHATRQGAWAAGYLAYEAAAGLDPKMAEAMDIAPNTKHAMPLLAFALFDAPDPDPVFANGLAGTHPCAAPSKPAGEIGLQWHVNETSDNYAKKIAAVRHAIAAGDAYQVNYTLRAQTQAGDGFSPWHYYESLQRRQQCRYGAYLDFGSHQVLSLSPELFFDWDRTDGRITTRPMKGTARRGTTPELDAALALQLQTSAKERAENVMIVDLLRNDLGRIATTGSVHVQQLLQTEAYPTLWQMTSTVQATTRPDTTLVHVLQALFPCGSITGAPKLMAMRKIAALETGPRGPYCGAIGVINSQRAIFNVAIRTVLHEADGRMHCGAGGGITWPSDAEDEFAETLLKLQFLHTEPLPQQAFGLRETLLLTQGRYALLPLHLQRIEQSARVCGFSPVGNQARQQALQAFATQRGQGDWRVALTQTACGQIQIHGSLLAGTLSPPGNDWAEPDALPVSWLRPPAPIDASAAFPVALAKKALALDWGLLLHKTTQRAHYDAALAAHPYAWDVILHNSEGYATECTRGNLVLQTTQGCITPPLSHGLLPGVLREALLKRGTIHEGPIVMQRLLQPQPGDILWFINSVRGWRPIRLDQNL